MVPSSIKKDVNYVVTFNVVLTQNTAKLGYNGTNFFGRYIQIKHDTVKNSLIRFIKR